MLAGYRLPASGHQDRISHELRADSAFGSLHDPKYSDANLGQPGATLKSRLGNGCDQRHDQCLSMSLHPGTNDPEPLHAELESGAVHPQPRRCATRTGDDTHLVSFRVARMCSRSASSIVRRLVPTWLAGALD